MEKKIIQEERMRGYFLDAAKDLIRGEGIEVVTARNVAERAGYSYATLYNYFKDIRDLIFACIEDFMKDCLDFVAEKAKDTEPGAEKLQIITKGYMNFFVQYPAIFELFYSLKPSSISTGKSNIESLYSFFDTLTAGDWDILLKGKNNNVTENETVKNLHKLAVHGALSLYLNRRFDTEYRDFALKIEQITEFFIKCGDK